MSCLSAVCAYNTVRGHPSDKLHANEKVAWVSDAVILVALIIFLTLSATQQFPQLQGLSQSHLQICLGGAMSLMIVCHLVTLALRFSCSRSQPLESDPTQNVEKAGHELDVKETGHEWKAVAQPSPKQDESVSPQKTARQLRCEEITKECLKLYRSSELFQSDNTQNKEKFIIVTQDMWSLDGPLPYCAESVPQVDSCIRCYHLNIDKDREIDVMILLLDFISKYPSIQEGKLIFTIGFATQTFVSRGTVGRDLVGAVIIKLADKSRKNLYAMKHKSARKFFLDINMFFKRLQQLLIQNRVCVGPPPIFFKVGYFFESPREIGNSYFRYDYACSRKFHKHYKGSTETLIYSTPVLYFEKQMLLQLASRFKNSPLSELPPEIIHVISDSLSKL